ncbi:VOC family protein [Geodermatophilus sp. YIM 151500]|uniref:VOC family protein n=1 Tax=Geodermatophilus sp. YIM 151500 TaxID=2984531 RepID=UPI0021E44AAB|nr:VOC family protein [Geodermatophilus sp. YIM 151500]MCV2490212.1 VOC family protein [Geodermatophilus sp. YIM 151500]
MEQRLTMVTLGVTDLDSARRFYLDGLGWRPLLDAGEAVFLQVGPGILLALYGRADLAAEAGTVAGEVPPPPFSLAHNVGSEEEVRRVVERMVAAGGELVAPPARAPWGGFTAYVGDPDGFRWEIAHNPGLVVRPDGSVRFGAVEEDGPAGPAVADAPTSAPG